MIMNKRNVELEAICKTANLYVEGIHMGNIDMLRSAFHPKAMMYGCSGDNVVVTEIEGLYSFVSANESPSKTGEPHQCFISDVHYAGNAAFVEMVEESGYGNDYTNYFQLLKIEGHWVIVSKSYNATPSKK